MKNDLPVNPTKKAALVKGRSSNSSNPTRDMRAALLAGFVMKYRRVKPLDYEKWINK